jgi:hypothetical protein
MRARTVILAAVATTMGLAPGVASANGGAYIEFEGTHHLPGEQVTGEVYVSVPRSERHLLDRGPFYAYLLPGNAFIEAGHPIPPGAIRVGTFMVEPGGGKPTELRVSFTVPQVTGDYYQVALCNDPCTVDGFGETVSGSVSIVATAREATLLTQNGKLHARAAGLERDLRKAEKTAEEQAAVTSAALAESEAEGQALHSQVRSLEADVASAQERAASAEGRIPVEPWAAAVIAVAIALVTWAIARRGRDASTSQTDVVPEHA